MKKVLSYFLRILLTLAVLAFFVHILLWYDYFRNFGAVDNLIGAMPVILSVCISSLAIALVWKRHRGKTASTLVLAILCAFDALLFVPAYNGNWFFTARTLDTTGLSAPDAEVMELAERENPSDTVLESALTLDGATALYPVYASFANAVYPEADGMEEQVLCTNTAGAYSSLIAGERDIIFVAAPSARQRAAAEAAGIDMVFTPIGKEAFVFLVSKNNPVDSITEQQIRNIYSGKTAKWSTLGWAEGGEIIAFQRAEGSGSQSGLQRLMGDLPVFKPRALPDACLAGNGRLTEQITVKYQGIEPALGYSYRYYATKMYPNEGAKLLAVNGVYPDEASIADGSYPFASEFYAVTNGPPTGEVKVFLDWILSEEGQELVGKVGYVPLA